MFIIYFNIYTKVNKMNSSDETISPYFAGFGDLKLLILLKIYVNNLVVDTAI